MNVSLPPPPNKDPSVAALFRYQVICQVHARALAGHTLVQSVREVSLLAHERLNGAPCGVSKRSIYRWLRAYATGGLSAL
jgi:hypothetical protein